MKIWRPPKYTQKSFKKTLESYLLDRKWENGSGIITILDFCVYAGITREYLSDHASSKHRDTDQDFSDTIKRLRIEAEASMEINALRWKVSIPMAIFCLKNNHGWSDKKEEESNNKREPVNLIFWLPPSQFVKPEFLPKEDIEGSPYSREYYEGNRA
jgi:hypothetical protein